MAAQKTLNENLELPVPGQIIRTEMKFNLRSGELRYSIYRKLVYQKGLPAVCQDHQNSILLVGSLVRCNLNLLARIPNYIFCYYFSIQSKIIS